MGLIAGAYARLSEPDAIRRQVQAYLFLARVHNSVKSSYEQYLAASSDEFGWHRASGPGQQQQQQPQIDWQLEYTRLSGSHKQNRPEIVARSQQAPDSALTQLTHRKQLGNNRFTFATPDNDREDRSLAALTRTSFDGRGWDWHGFPNLWLPFEAYDWVSISWMGFASFRSIFTDQLNALVDPLSRWLMSGRPGNCLLMGHLARPFGISEFLTILLASYHVGWRIVQARAKRTRLVTMIVFLLASERDLERVYVSLEEKDRSAQFDCQLQGEDDDDEQLTWARQSQWNKKRTRAIPSQSTGACSKNKRLFRQVMCYQVHRNQRAYFRLRPNRTREARKLLGRRVAAVSIVTGTFFALQTLIGLVTILVWICSDYRYARTYPGCYPLLDERLARNELTYFSSFTLRNHHLLSVCVDLISNIIFWGDSGVSLTFVLSFNYLLNYDLLLYWSELHRKLESLAQRSKCAYLSQVSKPADTDPPAPLPCQTESLWALERDIREVQFEMFDFFHQVRKVDLIVGDTLTYGIVAWLTFFAFFNYNLLMNDQSSLHVSFVIELIVALALFVLSLSTYHLLQLRHSCLKSYGVLCTLMAYDQTREKLSLINLMDFYLSARNWTTYHLWRTYAYKPTTFITIMGWSLSCFSIAFTLFKPHR